MNEYGTVLSVHYIICLYSFYSAHLLKHLLHFPSSLKHLIFTLSLGCIKVMSCQSQVIEYSIFHTLTKPPDTSLRLQSSLCVMYTCVCISVSVNFPVCEHVEVLCLTSLTVYLSFMILSLTGPRASHFDQGGRIVSVKELPITALLCWCSKCGRHLASLCSGVKDLITALQACTAALY